MISDVGNAVFTYFSDLVESVKSFFTGSTTCEKTFNLDYLTNSNNRNANVEDRKS